MDFGHYNRDTAFGYSENGSGEVDLTIYLGGDNVKDFSIITGGNADIVRLKQLIMEAQLEKGRISGSELKAQLARNELENAGIKVWLTPCNEAVFEETEEAEEPIYSSGVEFIMDACTISKRLKDDTRIKKISLISYSHYGYDNNYTRGHEETEYILESMIALVKNKASRVRGDFEMVVENIVKNGQGDSHGSTADPEERTFEAVYSYHVKSGELCISELYCDDIRADFLKCPACEGNISFDELKAGLKDIKDRGYICPYCKASISAEILRRSISNGGYLYRKRDLMPVYISADDISCVSFLGDGCSEERIEKYLKQAMEEKSQNCVAALLQYKERHFEKKDFLSDFALSDDWDDDLFGPEDRAKEAKADAFGNDPLSGAAASAFGTSSMSGVNSCITLPDTDDPDMPEVLFGRYKGEPIRWKVISRIGSEALIITKECIDSRNFNLKYEKCTWEKSALRQWLNNDFMEEAFSSEERGCILDTPLFNGDNHFSKVPGGNDTSDRVFILNIDEAEFYFDDCTMRQARAGKEALSKRAYVAGTGFTAWWLRTPGSDEYHASNVDYYGIANVIGFLVNYTGNCIRPAMWVKLA